MLIGLNQRAPGFALLTVLIFAGLGIFILSGALQWSSQTARLTQRNNEYHGGTAAGEAAAEKVIGQIAQDYFGHDKDYVESRLDWYRSLIPNAKEQSIWANYKFTSLDGTPNRVSVDKTASWAYGDLQTKYTGLRGYSAVYRITATATDLRSSLKVPVSAQQDLQIASIPIFGFGVFYFPDLEICPDASFSVSGRVHSNANIYADPKSTLVFQSHVTAAGKIVHGQSPMDPVSRKLGTIVYRARHDGDVNSLNLPAGTNNTPDVLRALVEIPPASESPASRLGQQRYFNKADLIIRVYDDRVLATSGAANNFGVVIPWLQTQGIVKTNVYFYDKRENKWVQTTEIDIQKLNQQYSNLIMALGRAPKTIYVADLRTQSGDVLSSVRLVNGQTLPQSGLTVATPNPLYVRGHYNAYQAYWGTTNTSVSAPASLVADAITVLSPNWQDSNSGEHLHKRKATATTINAAALAGIVPSGGGYYSGGLENFLRFLENWNGITFTFNGSMVALCDSRMATAPWGSTGDIYSPPTRAWSSDPNFQQAGKLPPSTPELRAVIRGKWSTSKALTAS